MIWHMSQNGIYRNRWLPTVPKVTKSPRDWGLLDFEISSSFSNGHLDVGKFRFVKGQLVRQAHPSHLYLAPSERLAHTWSHGTRNTSISRVNWAHAMAVFSSYSLGLSGIVAYRHISTLSGQWMHILFRVCLAKTLFKVFTHRHQH